MLARTPARIRTYLRTYVILSAMRGERCSPAARVSPATSSSTLRLRAPFSCARGFRGSPRNSPKRFRSRAKTARMHASERARETCDLRFSSRTPPLHGGEIVPRSVGFDRKGEKKIIKIKKKKIDGKEKEARQTPRRNSSNRILRKGVCIVRRSDTRFLGAKPRRFAERGAESGIIARKRRTKRDAAIRLPINRIILGDTFCRAVCHAVCPC